MKRPIKSKSTRGFDLLAGRTIVAIDYECVNRVTLTDAAGNLFAINADGSGSGIPVLTVEQLKNG